MKKKGSITVGLCLVLSLMLSLIAVSIRSVRTAGARVQIAAGMEQGLYSVFAQYNRTLLEKYDVFFVDSSYGTGGFHPEQMYRTLENVMEKVLHPERDRTLPVRADLWHLNLDGGAITGYALATDGRGAFFRQQAVEYMKETLGEQGIQLILERLKGGSAKEEEGDSAIDDLMDEFDREKANAKAQESEPALPAADEPEKNPIEVIREIRKMGVLSLVLKDTSRLSSLELDTSSLSSNRSLHSGMGTLPLPEAGDISDRALLMEYAMTHFPCFTTGEGAGLTCQIEYLLEGKGSDTDNLKKVAAKLLAVREAANLLYLSTDAAKKAEVDAMALAITSAFGLPAAQQLVSALLMACWAFGESILDVRELLDGGKTELIKSAAGWQLSLENLPELLNGLDSFRKSSAGGITYEDYLRIFLLAEKEETLSMRMLDMIEQTMWQEGETNFLSDRCVCWMEAQMSVSEDMMEFDITRSYGYYQ